MAGPSPSRPMSASPGFRPGLVASGKGHAGKRPLFGEEAAEASAQGFFQVFVTGSHPVESVDFEARQIIGIDVATTQAERFIRRHHRIGEGVAQHEFALVPAQIDQVLLQRQPSGSIKPIRSLSLLITAS